MLKNILKVVIIISFLILISSCKDQKNKRIVKSNILIEKRNGLIYKQRSEKPYTGIIVDTLNGKIMEYYVKDGLKNGPFKISGIDGNVEISGNMINDKNEGEWRYYFLNGKLESVGDFKNDTPSGKWTFFYRTGIKKEEGEYKNGKRDGKWIEFDSLGKVNNYTFFSKGDTIK